MSNELNPCGCGATPIEDGKSDDLRIRCEKCGMQGPSFDFIYDEDEADIDRARGEAVAAWNASHPITTPAASGQQKPMLSNDEIDSVVSGVIGLLEENAALKVAAHPAPAQQESALKVSIINSEFIGGNPITYRCDDTDVQIISAFIMDGWKCYAPGHHPAAQQESETLHYAKHIATSIWRDNYKATAPEWKPFDDLHGILSQIDNMTCGMRRAPAPAALTNVKTWQERMDGVITAGMMMQMQATHRAMESEIVDLRAILATASAAPAEQARDAEILRYLEGDDFVSLHQYEAVYDGDGQPLGTPRRFFVAEAEHQIPTIEGDTARAAILAAIASQQKGGV